MHCQSATKRTSPRPGPGAASGRIPPRAGCGAFNGRIAPRRADLTEWLAASVSAALADQEIPGPANRDPDSRSRPRESGIGDSLFPGQIGNPGFPPRFPAKNREIGGIGNPIS